MASNDNLIYETQIASIESTTLLVDYQVKLTFARYFDDEFSVRMQLEYDANLERNQFLLT